MCSYSSRDFADGLSLTVGLSEKIVGDGTAGRFDARRDFWHSAAGTNGIQPQPEYMVRVCESLSAANPPHYSDGGFTWMMAGFENTFYNHLAGPNSRFADCSRSDAHSSRSGGGVFSARSWHRGGVHCLMMAGEVRFVSDSVVLDVWQAISTRSGGEHVSGTDF